MAKKTAVKTTIFNKDNTKTFNSILLDYFQGPCIFNAVFGISLSTIRNHSFQRGIGNIPPLTGKQGSGNNFISIVQVNVFIAI